MDFWTFIVAFLALVATAYFGYKTLRKQDEQLELARREAERHPLLKVSEMNLIDAREVDAVLDTAKKREEWLEEIRQYEERQRAANEKIAKGFNFAVYEAMELDPRINRIYEDDLIAQEDYEGPFPDKVLRVSLINLGKSAALDVTGQLFI